MMSWENITKAQIKAHEGLSLKLYKDSRNIATIGWGRNLEWKGISEGEARVLFENDFNAALEIANHYSFFEGLTLARKSVIVDMIFNLGEFGFAKFTKLITALNKKDYVEAAKEMRNSNWAMQVKTRADSLIGMMESGDY